MKKLTYDDFLEKYTPEHNQVLLKTFVPNEHTTQDDMCSYGGVMYETFGEELDYIREQPNKRVWTIIDAGGRDLALIAGRHFVNRFGYIVTKEEWEDEYEEYEA
jgi:hypothetical protein